MCTHKWQLLEHQGDSIMHVDGVQFLHGALYKGLNKMLKLCYAKRSNPQESATDEAVSTYNERFPNEHQLGRTDKQRARQI